MPDKSIIASVSRLCLILLLAFPVLPVQKPKFEKGQSFYVIAVRDSRLLTMCPPAVGVTSKGGAKEGEYPAIVTVLPDDMENISIVSRQSGSGGLNSSQSKAHHPMLKEDVPFGNRIGMIPDLADVMALPDIHYTSELILPAPAFVPSGSAASEPGNQARIELDRVTPDAVLKKGIEEEFQNQQQYQLADSIDKTDFVFLAEGTTIPLEMWTNAAPAANAPAGLEIFVRGDRKANLLNAVLGLIVPVEAYRQNAGNPAALLQAKVWEGSSIWEEGREPLPKGFQPKFESYARNLVPASPGALVRQFLGKEKMPSNHLPLCAASIEARGMPGVEPNQQIQQGSKTPGLDASLITVPATVTGLDGKYVSDLRTAKFHVFADNVEQRIEKVIPPTDPVDTILMLDTSSSTRSVFDEMQRWALAFVDALRPQDRLMVVTFDNQIFVLSDFTGDRDTLRGALFKVRKGESTRLYDALSLVVAGRMPVAPGRRAVVLFTDGVDTRSRLANAEIALGSIEESNVPIFVIRFDTKAEQRTIKPQPQRHPIIVPDGVLDNSPLYAFADQYLSSLVEESGGQIYPAKANDSTDGPVPFILDALHNQYNLCFHLTGTTGGDSLHNIRVTIERPGVNIRARARYRGGKSR